MNKNVAVLMLLVTALAIPIIVAKVVIVGNKRQSIPYRYEAIQNYPHAVPILTPYVSPAPTPYVSPAPQYQPPKAIEFIPDIRQGGRNLERSAMAQAAAQVRGASRGTLIHEATHMLQWSLNPMVGGQNQLQPSKGFCAFYFWGEDRYIIIPTAGFSKISVAPLVPMECISRFTFNNYFSSMFASRDAIHICEDYVAELNGFEADSPDLLRDMMIYSIALGIKMKQQNHPNLREYQAANKYLIERTVQKAINVNAFRQSNSNNAVIMKKYLVDTYGQDWTYRVGLL